MGWTAGAGWLTDLAENEARTIRDNRNAVKRLQREITAAQKNRASLLKQARVAARGEAALKAQGGVTNSETLAMYHDHACSMNLGWSDTVFCGGGGYRNPATKHESGVWIRHEHGWTKATPEEEKRHWTGRG